MSRCKFRPTGPARIAAATASALLGTLAWAQQASNGELTRLEGDPERGKEYFTSGYKCYACHGYDAQTGEKRLKPINLTQEAFIVFVQNSPLPLMPAYNDMPAQALADVYAYIQSIPVDAPDVSDIELLSGVMNRKLDEFE